MVNPASKKDLGDFEAELIHRAVDIDPVKLLCSWESCAGAVRKQPFCVCCVCCVSFFPIHNPATFYLKVALERNKKRALPRNGSACLNPYFLSSH